MSDIKIDLGPVAGEIKRQLQNLVPVRTGRLKRSIDYVIKETQKGYTVSFIMEDYIAWLKPKTKQDTLPSSRELALASPPLPKMNNLHFRGVQELSPRSQSIFRKVDVEIAFDRINREELEESIRRILVYDL